MSCVATCYKRLISLGRFGKLALILYDRFTTKEKNYAFHDEDSSPLTPSEQIYGLISRGNKSFLFDK